MTNRLLRNYGRFTQNNCGVMNYCDFASFFSCEPFINNPTAIAPQRCAQSKGIFSNISVCKCICTGHEIVSGGQNISTRNIWEKKIYHLVSIGQEAKTEKLPSSWPSQQEPCCWRFCEHHFSFYLSVVHSFWKETG